MRTLIASTILLWACGSSQVDPPRSAPDSTRTRLTTGDLDVVSTLPAGATLEEVEAAHVRIHVRGHQVDVTHYPRECRQDAYMESTDALKVLASERSADGYTVRLQSYFVPCPAGAAADCRVRGETAVLATETCSDTTHTVCQGETALGDGATADLITAICKSIAKP